MKKFLLVMITFAFISGSFANDLSKSVVKNDVKSKIESLSTLSFDLNSAIPVLPTVSETQGCSFTLKWGGFSKTFTYPTCEEAAQAYTSLVSEMEKLMK